MSARNFQLADLLTAGGNAMGSANLRLTAGGAPALLQTYNFSFSFPGSAQVLPGAAGLLIRRPAAGPCRTPGGSDATVQIQATYIAAPSLVPVRPT